MKETVERRLGGGAARLREVFNSLPHHQTVLSHSARRHAKKCFKKHKQVPAGYVLQYKMGTSIDPKPEPSARLKADWAFLDIKSKEMFGRIYDNLSDKQKSKLIESMHKGD